MFYKCMNKSIDNVVVMLDSIKDNQYFEVHKFDLFYNIVIAIHFIGDCCNRLYNEYKNVKFDVYKYEMEYLNAFRYLNNCLKHDVNLNKFYQEICDGGQFPFKFPMHFGAPPSLVWFDFDNNIVSSPYATKSTYDRYLLDKDIKETLIEVQKIINNLHTIIQMRG